MNNAFLWPQGPDPRRRFLIGHQRLPFESGVAEARDLSQPTPSLCDGVGENRRNEPVRAAERLQAALLKRGLETDTHVLTSSQAAISVAPGLLVRTDGRYLWWVVWGPDGTRRSTPRLAVYMTPELAAERLSQHPAVVERLRSDSGSATHGAA